MYRKLIFSVMLVGILALGLTFISCDVGKSALVGNWILDDHGSELGLLLQSELTLNKDGTGFDDGRPISWRVENKRLLISVIGLWESSYDYKISGKKLTLTNSKTNQSRTYVKY